MNTKRNKILLAGAVMAFGLSIRVAALPVVLVPGTSEPLVVETLGAGAVLVTSEIDSFSVVTINGAVGAAVYRNDSNNPWASAGGLTFTYQIRNSTTSADAITGIGIDGWIRYLTDVAYFASVPGGVITPGFATRSLDATTVTFGWQDPPLGTGLIRLGSYSDTVVIYTNATSWDWETGGVRDGSGATMNILGPANIPDGGTTALLLGFGLLGMCWTVRRFKTS